MRLRIYEIRTERGMTQEDVAAATGLDPTVISKLEREVARFNQDHIEALCAGLQIEPCDLFDSLNGSNRSRRATELFETLPDQWQEFVLAQLESAYAQHKAQTQSE